MILITDSGSTKADWALIEGGRCVSRIQTCGFNPYMQTTDDMVCRINDSALKKIAGRGISHLWFYGAGCTPGDKSLSVAMALRAVFGQDCDVTVVHVNAQHIEYCIGCFACKHNGGTCVLHDDMAVLLEQMLESDVIVYSFPLYSYGMPGAIKNFIDRTMPLSSWNMVRNAEGKYGHEMQFDVSRMHFVMICGCGFPNSKHNFEGAVRSFELKYPNSTVITVPESPMFNIPQAAQFVGERCVTHGAYDADKLGMRSVEKEADGTSAARGVVHHLGHQGIVGAEIELVADSYQIGRAHV